MEQPVRRRENETKFSPRRRPVVNKEDKVDDILLPSLANLSLAEGLDPKTEGKLEAGKKPKRTFTDLRPVVQDLLNECFSKLNLVPNDLDPSIYDSLLDFPDPVQCEIVASFCRADLASIRNKTGYFIGILKQYRKNGKATGSGNNNNTNNTITSNLNLNTNLNNSVYSPAAAFNSLPFQYMNPPSPYLYPSPFGNFFPAQYNSFAPYNYGLMQGLPSPPLKNPGKGLGALSLSIQIKFRTMFANGDVNEDELDDSIYDSLQDFDEFTQTAILDRFSSTKFSKVRNKTGYFISLLKLARQARATDLGFAEAVAGSFYPSYPAYGGDMYGLYGQNAFSTAPSYLLPPPQANLSPSFSKICLKAQARLAHLYNTFIIRRTDLEDCVFDSLADFPETDQLRMCDAFAQANLINVRNKTAFFIGILKRHRSHLASPEIITQQSIA